MKPLLINHGCFGVFEITEPQLGTSYLDRPFLFLIIGLIFYCFFVLNKRKRIPVAIDSNNNPQDNSWLMSNNNDILMQTKNPDVLDEKLPFVNFSPSIFYLRSLLLIVLLVFYAILWLNFTQLQLIDLIL